MQLLHGPKNHKKRRMVRLRLRLHGKGKKANRRRLIELTYGRSGHGMSDADMFNFI